MSRVTQLARGQQLAAFTVAYNLIEGAIAITAGIAAASQALIGFGADSGVESISATVLLWRLGAERRDPDRAERVEHAATRAIGVSFLLLAAWVAYESITALAGHDEPDAAPVGLALTAVSLIVMPVLARRKQHVAAALHSRAAAADAAQTMACVWLSGVVLVGLALNTAFEWWWADPLAALAVVILLLNEAREALLEEDN